MALRGNSRKRRAVMTQQGVSSSIAIVGTGFGGRAYRDMLTTPTSRQYLF